MTQAEQDRRRTLKRNFILGGIVTGVLLSCGYLALNITHRSLLGGPAPPDPVWARFVNVFLIIAACVLQASIFGRVAGWLTGRRPGRD